jgi:hypothetical protein
MQDKSAAEVTEMVLRAVAERAVVVEGGKPVEGFKVKGSRASQAVLQQEVQPRL